MKVPIVTSLAHCLLFILKPTHLKQNSLRRQLENAKSISDKDMTNLQNKKLFYILVRF